MSYPSFTSMARLVIFFSLLTLALISSVSSRVLSSESENTSILVSDGVHEGSSDFEFNLSLDSKNECVHVYGFLPCADKLPGYVFQVFSYGCLLIIGDYFLSKGKSKLFVIFEVGFYGGIIFPLLTMFPRIALMLSSGLIASPEVANAMVDNNVGVTVGYAVFALTIQWGSCIVFGLDWSKKDEVEDESKSKLLKIAECRIEADPKNKKTAAIMVMSLAPFVMVIFSEIFNSASLRDGMVLITLILSASATLFYFFYLYFDTADQQKSLEHARFELMSEVHMHLQRFSPQNFMKDGELNQESLESLFNKIDVNKDGKIQIEELRDLSVEFGMVGRVKCDINDLATALVADFDQDKDGSIDKNEFKLGLSKWLAKYKSTLENDSQRENNEEDSKVVKMEKPKESLLVKLVSKRFLKASTEVIVGIVTVIFLAKPFMMNIELMAVSAGVPSFYVVFVAIPLARNLKNTLSARFCRKKDKARIASDTFSEIYRDVTMNNLMGISIILAIVYCRGLEWNYSLETVILVIVGLMIGVPAYVRKTYPFWICLMAFALYFISIIVVYFNFMSLNEF